MAYFKVAPNAGTKTGENKTCVQNLTANPAKQETTWEVQRRKDNIKMDILVTGCVIWIEQAQDETHSEHL